MQPTALKCTRCGAAGPAGARFCASCGGTLAAPPPPPPVYAQPGGACPSCGTVLQPGSRFCSRCGHQAGAAPVAYQQPMPQTQCGSCRRPLPPAAQFCAACGALAGSVARGGYPRAARSGGTLAFTWRTVGADVAFALILFGSFLDWVTYGGHGGGAFDDGARFRFCDWLDTTSMPVDGLLALGLAALGLLVTGMATARRMSDATSAMLMRTLGSAALAFGILQMQYIKSEASSLDWGIGLYLIVAGGIGATIATMLPAKPVGGSR